MYRKSISNFKLWTVIAIFTIHFPWVSIIWTFHSIVIRRTWIILYLNGFTVKSGFMSKITNYFEISIISHYARIKRPQIADQFSYLPIRVASNAMLEYRHTITLDSGGCSARANRSVPLQSTHPIPSKGKDTPPPFGIDTCTPAQNIFSFRFMTLWNISAVPTFIINTWLDTNLSSWTTPGFTHLKRFNQSTKT